jgi:protein SCO1/2
MSRIGIDQKLNQQVPLDLAFTDDTGREVRLGEYFGKRPVILALVYYECPMLCTQVLNGVATALGVLNFTVGKEFDVVAVSINPREGPGLAAQKKAAYVERYGRPGSERGWHFLTGRQESIAALADAVGFRYEYDETTKQYAHGAGIEVLTPNGVISKYFYGIEYSSRDLKFGLMEASAERIGTAIDQALLLCYHYDPATGKYGATAMTLIRLGGIATILAFVSFLFVSLRRERASRRGGPVSAHRT